MKPNATFTACTIDGFDESFDVDGELKIIADDNGRVRPLPRTDDGALEMKVYGEIDAEQHDENRVGFTGGIRIDDSDLTFPVKGDILEFSDYKGNRLSTTPAIREDRIFKMSGYFQMKAT